MLRQVFAQEKLGKCFFQKEYVKNCPEGWIKNKKLPKYAKRLNFMQEFWTTIYDNYILRALFFYIYSFFCYFTEVFLDQDTLLVYCNIAGYFLVTFRRSGKSDLVLSLAGLHKAHSTAKTVSDTFSTDISG